MRFIIGLVIFWLSTIGYILYVNKKTKLPYSLALPLVFTLIAIAIFVSGILNIMKVITLLIWLVGFILFGYYLLKKQINLKKIINPNTILVVIVVSYITIVCTHMHLLQYDNFSHWALIVKTLFTKNAFPNFEDTIIMFKGYQPGSACFIYYVGMILGKTESSMIIGQNYLIASYLFSLLYFANNKFKSSHLIRAIIISFYFIILVGNVYFNDLLVDTLLTVMSIYSAIIMYHFKDDLYHAFIYIIPISVYLILVKNVGLVLVGFNCLGLLYLGYKNNKIKKSIIYSAILGIISLLFFYIWSQHVSYAYGDLALDTKHSLSTSNILGELKNKGRSGILAFCSIYFKHFIDVSNNLTNLYMIVINIVTIIIAILNKDNMKKIVKYLLAGDFIYLLYYIILGIMYLVSMPWKEAKVLASFDRYVLTIVYVTIGLLLICYFTIINNKKINSKVLISSVLIIGSLLLATNNKLDPNFNYDILIGNQNYKNTNAYVYDKIIDNRIFKNKENYYYIYAPIESSNDSGYLNHLSKYKLNTSNYKIINDTNLIENKKRTVIIIFDNNSQIKNYLNSHNYLKKTNRVYVK